jgi:alkanesulfonate monooxygenase SsuD/methylene tetrahydromethanopterin reductase-like flavin-dependent oxidoreductase (luciferase family)
MEFVLFLPQMRLSFDQLIERAQAAEAAGFTGISGMDHLAPPLAEGQPMYEAMVTNTWLAARTERIRVGSLVLCDAFRHPAVLAREAVSIDHASGGRFELGLGWGSVPEELATYGVGSTEPRQRVGRMKESLEIMRALWAGETVDYDGEFFTTKGARQEPPPLGHIPIVIGGTGPKTLALVREHADWWNVHTGALDKVQELRDQVGDAGVSIQERVAFVPEESQREEIATAAHRRFGDNLVLGDAEELIEHYGRRADQGVQRVYAWFCDFAKPETLAAFGEQVVAPLAPT